MKFYLLNVAKTGAVAVIVAAFQKYIFHDIEYLKWLMILVALDLLTGITKVWAKEGFNAITSKGMRMTIVKFIQYGAFLVVTNVLTSFTINGKEASPVAFVGDWAFILLILIEAKSIYENIVYMNPKLDFINSIIQKIAAAIGQATTNTENKNQDHV
ncbi:MAG: phage holin family protein [Chitinophagaceae bacterium]